MTMLINKHKLRFKQYKFFNFKLLFVSRHLLKHYMKHKYKILNVKYNFFSSFNIQNFDFILYKKQRYLKKQILKNVLLIKIFKFLKEKKIFNVLNFKILKNKNFLKKNISLLNNYKKFKTLKFFFIVSNSLKSFLNFINNLIIKKKDNLDLKLKSLILKRIFNYFLIIKNFRLLLRKKTIWQYKRQYQYFTHLYAKKKIFFSKDILYSKRRKIFRKSIKKYLRKLKYKQKNKVKKTKNQYIKDYQKRKRRKKKFFKKSKLYASKNRFSFLKYKKINKTKILKNKIQKVKLNQKIIKKINTKVRQLKKAIRGKKLTPSAFRKKYRKYLKLYKISSFGKQLRIYQKFKYFFGGLPRNQIKKFYHLALKTQKNYIFEFLSILESRIDIFLFRLNIFNSIFETKQFLLHNGILINNKHYFAYNFHISNFDYVSFLLKDKQLIFKQILLKINKFKYLNPIFSNKLQQNLNYILSKFKIKNNLPKNINKSINKKKLYTIQKKKVLKKKFFNKYNIKKNYTKKKKYYLNFFNKIAASNLNLKIYYFIRKRNTSYIKDKKLLRNLRKKFKNAKLKRDFSIRIAPRSEKKLFKKSIKNKYKKNLMEQKIKFLLKYKTKLIRLLLTNNIKKNLKIKNFIAKLKNKKKNRSKKKYIYLKKKKAVKLIIKKTNIKRYLFFKNKYLNFINFKNIKKKKINKIKQLKLRYTMQVLKQIKKKQKIYIPIIPKYIEFNYLLMGGIYLKSLINENNINYYKKRDLLTVCNFLRHF